MDEYHSKNTLGNLFRTQSFQMVLDFYAHHSGNHRIVFLLGNIWNETEFFDIELTETVGQTFTSGHKH